MLDNDDDKYVKIRKPTEMLDPDGKYTPKQITPKERVFIDAYILTHNRQEAARIAGYSDPSRVKSILKKPIVSIYINERTKELHNETDKISLGLQKKIKLDKTFEMTAEWKLEQLKKIVVAVIGDGTNINMRYANTAIAAISESNRMQGHYAPDKIDVNIKSDPDIVRLNLLCATMLDQKRIEIIKDLKITEFKEFTPAVLEDKSNEN